MQKLWYDLAFGFRMLLKNPRFTTVAVLSLAIGIGALLQIFRLPMPYCSTAAIQRFRTFIILWNRSPGLTSNRIGFTWTVSRHQG
jgi:hypothetical protein